MSTYIGDILNGYLYDKVKTLNQADFFNKVMQFDNDPTNVGSSDATFIFAGPPVLNPEKGWEGVANSNSAVVGADAFTSTASTAQLNGIWNMLKPIGAVQQYSLQQGRQVIPFTELGSRLKRHVVGSGQYSASLARVLSRSTNLRASLYSWLPDFLTHTGKSHELALAVTPYVKYDATGRKWEHFHWTGLESELFDLPFGLLCLTGTAGGKFVHAEYLERCYIPNISKGFSAGSAMIVENVSIMVTRPVAFTTRQNDTLIDLNAMFKHTAPQAITIQPFDSNV
jgi:hypothetical protein